VKALKWLFGDWRLWLIAILCVWALGEAGRLTSVPIQLHSRIEDRSGPNDTYRLLNESQSTAPLTTGDARVLGDYLLFLGGVRMWLFCDTQDPFSAMFSSKTVPTKMTFNWVASPWLAIIVMTLCGLLAVWWVGNWAGVWKWQIPFLAISLVGYFTLSRFLMQLVNQATGLGSYSQNVRIFPDVLGGLLHVVVIGGLSGGVALVLSRWFPRNAVRQRLVAAGTMAVRRTQEFVQNPNVQRTMRQAAAGASAAGTQVVHGLNNAFSGMSATKSVQSGWLCCPRCGNRDSKLFGGGKFPNQQSGARCSMCEFDLHELEISPNHPCVTCGNPMVVGAGYCHHCGANQHPPVQSALPDNESHIGV